MAHCEQCGSAIHASSAKFCANCGHPVATASPALTADQQATLKKEIDEAYAQTIIGFFLFFWPGLAFFALAFRDIREDREPNWPALIIGAAVMIVAAVAAFRGWSEYDRLRRRRDGGGGTA